MKNYQTKSKRLDQFSSAYTNSFKFKDENELMLKWFANILENDIQDFGPFENFLSLGIGFKILARALIKFVLDGKIKNYYIIEGSNKIINEFIKENKEISNVYIINNSFEKFEPPANLKFDRIEMGFVLEHVNEPTFLLSKYKNYLSSNGVIHIAVPNAKSLHRLIGFYAGLLDNLYKLSEHDLMLGHQRYYDLEKLTKDVVDTGLKIIEIKGLMLKPITFDQMKILNFDQNLFTSLMRIGEGYPEISNGIYIKVKPK